jgi:hypothetical protein
MAGLAKLETSFAPSKTGKPTPVGGQTMTGKCSGHDLALQICIDAVRRKHAIGCLICT